MLSHRALSPSSVSPFSSNWTNERSDHKNIPVVLARSRWVKWKRDELTLWFFSKLHPPPHTFFYFNTILPGFQPRFCRQRIEISHILVLSLRRQCNSFRFPWLQGCTTFLLFPHFPSSSHTSLHQIIWDGGCKPGCCVVSRHLFPFSHDSSTTESLKSLEMPTDNWHVIGCSLHLVTRKIFQSIKLSPSVSAVIEIQ